MKKEFAERIWDKLFVADNDSLSRSEQVALIESLLYQLTADSRKIGRNQVINHFLVEANNLKSGDNNNG